MAIDLKVHVKSFNCEDCSCYTRNPRESLLRVRERFFLFAQVSRKLDIMNHYHCIRYSLWRATTSCPPGAWQENSTAHAKLPKVRLRHSQIPWSWSTSLRLPLVLPNVAFWSLKNQAPNAAAKLPKVRPSLPEPDTKAPGVCFSSDAPPADGWGLQIVVFSRKFCEGVGASQSAFWTEWPSNPCKKN